MGSFSHLSGVMFDIETMGKRMGSAILSIGACRFDIDTLKIYDEFYVNISIEDSLRSGLTYDKSTLDWWKENVGALKGIQRDAVSAKDGLNLFFDYLSKKKREPLWAWGPHFDVPMVETAMQRILRIAEPPWKYNLVFDARTISNVFKVEIDRQDGTHHNALDDAKNQAKYVMEFFYELQSEGLEDDIPF